MQRLALALCLYSSFAFCGARWFDTLCQSVIVSCLKSCPLCLPMTAAPCAHTGLVDGWRAAGRAPSEPMFRAAFMSTTRLKLQSREAAAAMLSLMRESFEVGMHAAPCHVQRHMPGGLVKRSLRETTTDLSSIHGGAGAGVAAQQRHPATGFGVHRSAGTPGSSPAHAGEHPCAAACLYRKGCTDVPVVWPMGACCRSRPQSCPCTSWCSSTLQGVPALQAGTVAFCGLYCMCGVLISMTARAACICSPAQR